MKTRFIFYYLSFFCLLSIGEMWANSGDSCWGMEINLSSNNPPNKPITPKKGHRSISNPIPIRAFWNDAQIVRLEFYESIGNIEVIISQDGLTLYSSSENIEFAFFKSIPVSQEVSGCCLLEIKGENGVYVFGYFNL